MRGRNKERRQRGEKVKIENSNLSLTTDFGTDAKCRRKEVNICTGPWCFVELRICRHLRFGTRMSPFDSHIEGVNSESNKAFISIFKVLRFLCRFSPFKSSWNIGHDSVTRCYFTGGQNFRFEAADDQALIMKSISIDLTSALFNLKAEFSEKNLLWGAVGVGRQP